MTVDMTPPSETPRPAACGSVRDRTIALGVTFKPNTDDMREAPSLVILPMLQARGATIRACDPQGREKAEELLPNVEWHGGPIETAKDADVLVVLTEWNEFRAVDLKELRKAMRGNVLGRSALRRTANEGGHVPSDRPSIRTMSALQSWSDRPSHHARNKITRDQNRR